MGTEIDSCIALLERTPGALDALLRGLPDPWITRNEGGDSWDVFGVVGHLAHCERADWMPRVRMILESGESRTFVPLDRGGHVAEVQGKSLGDLLDDFAQLRAANLAELRRLDLAPRDVSRRGRHPRLGPVTLGELLSTWAAHDLTHVHQISRVMAHQYRDDVGPFRVFLGVLTCDGHSAPAA